MAQVDADDLRFVRGLKRDHTAVLNGLTLPYSSGAAEGNVNRIKMIKRNYLVAPTSTFYARSSAPRVTPRGLTRSRNMGQILIRIWREFRDPVTGRDVAS
jgi:hypothetical protein